MRAYVGAYLAELGGLDAVVFTAGIGEHDPATRAAVIDPFAHFGLGLDAAAKATADASEGPVRISAVGTSPVVFVIATAEEPTIAAGALAVIDGGGE